MAHELWVSRSDSGQSDSSPVVAPQSLAIARWCASRGWPVHPLAPGRKTPAANCEACRRPGHTHQGCACLQAGRWCHGFHAATLDFARIEQWWARNPGLGVGVACGPASLVVIDIDAHEQQPPERDRLLPGIPIPAGVDLVGLANGFHMLGVLAALRGATSPADDDTTLRVRTPSGGLHVWYRAHSSHRWQCSTGSGGGRALAWQVDVRAHGGYIVAPGTTTPAGTYTPVGPVREPAPLPNWLAHELDRTGHLPPAHVPAPRPVPPRARQAVIAAGGGRHAAGRALATVLGEVAACAAVPEGAAFSAKLNRAAYTAGGLVAAGHLTAGDAEQALRQAAEQARPGQERRYGAIIRSGLNAGSLRPLSPGGRA
ncbi:bifunctional DNA primase/polymerase [Streptomyces sp. WAC05374]|uniref:bifunctional DNA primase/polymerase n=1 Tax=unclassified Streptomyces TaxID=2593676 RepID=UPI000F88612B|nr:bifunctional DNA primase/polymerase [Streptomyces sp. WAC05374]RST16665.1 DNA primase [Streptomyces sp. WAC05374]TDF35992.1 bifunctional DNA primase/polymerase [Streptomyces sp. WAC05374]TDF44555.1 bifunctional DNA primase/polymerase [Streptomyces sp. WAC05374]TDF45685.1 bifunctional DNA primase/polymerase [Streptomyces sp. WAC05374]